VNDANGTGGIPVVIANEACFWYFFSMNAVELAVQEVKKLDEAQAMKLIEWMRTAEFAKDNDRAAPKGARAMLGFARRFRAEARTTADWMTELREGESC
jgi:hypothetical protein